MLTRAGVYLSELCKQFLLYAMYTFDWTLFVFDETPRQLYGLCQLFPDAACKAMQTMLSDSAHEMEEAIEVKGRASFPGLDMVPQTFLNYWLLKYE